LKGFKINTLGFPRVHFFTHTKSPG